MSFCQQCGAPRTPGATFCPSCGASLPPLAPPVTAPAVAPTTAPPAVTPSMAPGWGEPAPARVRPVGLTIIGVVTMVVGGLGIVAIGFAAIAVMAGAAFFGAFFGEWFEPGAVFAGAIAVMFLFIFAIAAAFLVFVIFVGSGVLKGQGWAWVAMIVLMAFNAVNGISSLAQQDLGGLFGIAVSGLVIWYFFQPDVKRWFGRG